MLEQAEERRERSQFTARGLGSWGAAGGRLAGAGWQAQAGQAQAGKGTLIMSAWQVSAAIDSWTHGLMDSWTHPPTCMYSPLPARLPHPLVIYNRNISRPADHTSGEGSIHSLSVSEIRSIISPFQEKARMKPGSVWSSVSTARHTHTHTHTHSNQH
jgi:hypothetical protein